MDELELTSPAFEHGRSIPRKHTCEGEDVSPPLAWSGVQQGTASLALVVDDPDAPGGTFTYWRAWGIDPTGAGLGESEVPPFEGRNDFGSVGWRGPCPPPGHGPHRYVFQLHALDGELEFPAGTAKAEVDRAIADHALGVAELVGIYER
jgi:Raf kinase inhibitor-like YbhB/YbcL family protein